MIRVLALTLLALAAVPALAQPARANAPEVRTYRSTFDVSVDEAQAPKVSTAPGDLWEIVYVVDAKAKVVHRKSIRRLDKSEVDTNFPQDYAIVGKASLRRDDGKSEEVVVAVNTSGSKVETIWLGDSMAVSTENSGAFMLWHTAKYARVK